MKLAQAISITLAEEEIILHPSLRNAMQLERREGGFRQLLQEINEGSLTAALAIIEPHADGLLYLENRVLDILPSIRPQLLAYVAACAGIDTDDAPKEAKKTSAGKPRKSVPFSEYLVSLYKISTGWLGWTPDVALDATPLEITLAYAGHMEMLRAVHGGGGKPSKDLPEDDRTIGAKFQGIFANRGTVKEGEPA